MRSSSRFNASYLAGRAECAKQIVPLDQIDFMRFMGVRIRVIHNLDMEIAGVILPDLVWRAYT